MSTKVMSLPIALLGDIVASRSYPDQRGLLRGLAASLATLPEGPQTLQSVALTIGDEFQGLFVDLASALDAWLGLRLALALAETPVEVRVGLGQGSVEDTGAAPAPAGQSGAAWWRARDGLDLVRDLERRSHWPRSLRTRFVGEGDRDAEVNAVLLLTDHLLAGMDAPDLMILDGLRRGRRQIDLASELGVSQSAVAKREGDNGVSAVYRAIAGLSGGDA